MPSPIKDPKRLPRELRELANRMDRVARAMRYFGGFGAMAQHGREMAGAAEIARGWAKGIEEAPPCSEL